MEDQKVVDIINGVNERSTLRLEVEDWACYLFNVSLIREGNSSHTYPKPKLIYQQLEEEDRINIGSSVYD